MMPSEIARQWFVPGEGIDRYVISADIQRYLGNDATVRPGQGTGTDEGVPGYWIKAYRNLTNAMIADLRADSSRWRQEQKATGTRESYVGSSTYHASAASGAAGGRTHRDRRDNDSPTVETPYGVPPSRGGREPPRRMDIDRMEMDQPSAAPDRRGYLPERDHLPGSRRPEYPDNRAFSTDNRQPYQTEQPAGYGREPPRVPVSSPYAQDPRQATAGVYQPPGDGAPPGYVRQGNFYVPVSSAPPMSMPPGRTEPQYPPGPYSQPAPPQGRDPRDPRGDPRGDPRDPRYAPQQEYQDPRYAYPSPALTVPNPREPISSPPAQSYGGAMPYQTDQYGRPVYPPGQQDPGYGMPSTRDPAYGRSERQPAPSGGERDARRRRI